MVLQGQRQALFGELGAAHEDDAALDGVLQFAHIARPGIGEQQFHALAGDAVEDAAVLLGEPAGEVVDEQADVVAALAQGRHGEHDHVEAVVEVLAEGAAPHLLLQIAVGGGEDAHVDAHRRLAADALQFLLLQHPQQLDLHRRRGLADLVEEEGAAVGLDELALAAAVGAGEGPLLVTEELRLEQGLGQGGAVDLDEGLVASRAVAVQGLGDQLLAGARLPGDEHRRLGGGDVADHLEEFLHGRRSADDGGVECRPLLGCLLPAGRHLAVVHRAQQRQAQPVEVERLGEVVVGPLAHGLDGVLHRRVGGHDDHRQARLHGVDAAEGLVAVHARHAHVHEHRVVLLAPHRRHRRAAVVGLGGAPAPLTDKRTEGIAVHLVVVDHQNGDPCLPVRSHRPSFDPPKFAASL